MQYFFPEYNKNIEADSIEEATEKLHKTLKNDSRAKKTTNKPDIEPSLKEVSGDN